MIKRVTGAALLAVLAAGSLTLVACGRSDGGDSGGKVGTAFNLAPDGSGPGAASSLGDAELALLKSLPSTVVAQSPRWSRPPFARPRRGA
ncbi:hypothetical protein WMF26_13175 [Sorangium sp. So ce185]|uniref:hypothetical protein n=1 Tax=Sorangium sp. So ce185 TaxID=3133287 RepID=UPI003F5E887B